MSYCTVQEVAEFLTQLGFSDPAISISGITLVGVTPVQIYAVSHGFSTADVVTFESVGGTVGLNGNFYSITVIDANNFTLDGTNSSLFAAWTNGGIVYIYGEINEGTWPDKELIQRHIDLAAAEIDMTLQASDQLTCSKTTTGAIAFLKMLNIIGAMLLTEFDSARLLTPQDLTRHQEWKDNNLTLIRTGELALCDGETGLNYPAVATSEIAYTPEGAINIIMNEYFRNQ